MDAFLELFPVVAFFVAYFVTGQDFFVATIVILVAVAIQIIAMRLRGKKLSTMAKAGNWAIIGFGLLTLILKNELFFQLKPTIVNWLFAAVFLGSQIFTPRPLIQRLFEGMIEGGFTKPVPWRNLNLAWVLFFVAMGAANLYVLGNYDESTWVKFKLFGLVGASLVFSIANAVWLVLRYGPDDPATETK